VALYAGHDELSELTASMELSNTEADSDSSKENEPEDDITEKDKDPPEITHPQK